MLTDIIADIITVSRQQFLKSLPQEIAEKIKQMARDSHLENLVSLQLILQEVYQHRVLPFTVVLACTTPELQQPLPLMAVINMGLFSDLSFIQELYFAGFLAELQIPEKYPVPDFFGPKIKNIIERFKGRRDVTLQIRGTSPRLVHGVHWPSTGFIDIRRSSYEDYFHSFEIDERIFHPEFYEEIHSDHWVTSIPDHHIPVAETGTHIVYGDYMEVASFVTFSNSNDAAPDCNTEDDMEEDY